MRRVINYLVITVTGFLFYSEINAQQSDINFHHLTTKNGLNDGGISAICQDKYGFMWFASLGALNRFDGSSVTKFTHNPNDSTSVPEGIAWTITCDNNGRLWAGYDSGLYEYIYKTNTFRKIWPLNNYFIASITPYKNKLFITGYGKFLCYNTTENTLEQLSKPGDTTSIFNQHTVRSVFIKKDNAYFGCAGGYIIYSFANNNGSFFPVKEMGEQAPVKLLADKFGYLWLCNGPDYKFIRVSIKNNKAEDLNKWLNTFEKKTKVSVNDFAEDNNSNIWISTSSKGLLQYNYSNGQTMLHQHSEQLTKSPLSNISRCIYHSRDNNIWQGGNAGVDYFNPEKPLFHTIRSGPDYDNNFLARGITEDKDGNYWFSTGDGITRYNPVTKKYKIWHNEPGKADVIYHNSCRAVLADDNDNIWIATGKGVNRYNQKTEKIDFFSTKDSIPQAFYFSANKDREGTLWFGTKDFDGLYYYVPSEKKFHGIGTHPALKVFSGYGVRIVYEDSKGRLWIGFNGSGLGMYNKKTGVTHHWVANDKSLNAITGNLVTDIKEDNKGIIWVSTFNGINGINPETGFITKFTDKNGLKTTVTSSIAIDSLNRLWIGTAAGLIMMDKERKFFKLFGEENGLPSIEFSEHPGYYAKNGDIILPTLKGCVVFNPLMYKEEKSNLRVFISGISILDKDYTLRTILDSDFTITFNPDENFFSFSFSALNYENPVQTHYAYKLEGFDKEWQYSQIPKAIYTNVPGGTYVLHYKATGNPNDWNVEEKIITVIVKTYFYKQWWFPYLLIALALLTGYFVYSYRNRNIRKLNELHNKAQLLEKEKALVMYENLKQHLNPHFLFNSLTSLGSLITIDPKQAGNFLDKMSKVYRYILKNRDNETVPLSEELKFVQLYIDLQKTRFENGLIVNVNIDEEHYYRKIAPVTLQNLVENAIKHNTADREMPLRIDLFVEDNYLIVRNNLQKKTFVETSNKLGLANMESLYCHLSNRPMEILENEKYFTIKIPLL